MIPRQPRESLQDFRMSIPKRHHYLPQFYLKAWSRADDTVVSFRRPHRLVLAEAKTPYATGFEDRLYSIPTEPDPESQEQVELRWMSPIDNEAAKVRDQLIETPGKRLTRAQIDAWILFLISMIFRTPARLRWMNDRIRNYDYHFSEEEQAEYQQLRPKDAPATPESYFSDSSDEELSTARMQLMLSMIKSEVFGRGIADMQWYVHSITGNHGLLTCDDPVITSNGMNKDESFVILPLSPQHLFIAANTRAALLSYITQTDRALERGINDALVAQAAELVIGSTERHLKFIERRLGSTPAGEGILGRPTWKVP